MLKPAKFIGGALAFAVGALKWTIISGRLSSADVKPTEGRAFNSEGSEMPLWLTSCQRRSDVKTKS